LDKIIKIDGSVLQHGKYNDRVYIMKINPEKSEEIIEKSEQLAKEHGYGKIFAKVPSSMGEHFQQRGFSVEASVPEFFKNGEECVFYSKYLDKDRQKDAQEEDNERNLETAFTRTLKLKDEDEEIKKEIIVAREEHAADISKLMEEVFPSYPFPVFDKDYIIETMKDNIVYYCYYDGDVLAGVSSSEKDEYNKNAEMTDFAIKEEYRGKNLSQEFLRIMEEDLKKDNYKLLYTIARSASAGMNVTFAREGYVFSGKLVNNTNIFGDIESMNVWYKKL